MKWLCPSALCLIVLSSACWDQPEEEEPENLPPYACLEIGSEADPVTGMPIWFDATRSDDDDGVIASYVWSFGDGTVVGGEAQLAHIYETAGEYLVGLEVTDDSGDTAYESAWLTVGAVATAHITADSAVLFGVPATFDGTGSTTTGGELEWYAWDMGDGQVEYGPVVTHTYGYPGEYVVMLYVDGDDDVSTQVEQFVDVYVPSFEGTWSWALAEDGQPGPPCSAFPSAPVAFYEGSSGDPRAFFVVQGEGANALEYDGRLDTLDFVVGRSGPFSSFTVAGTFTSPSTFTGTFSEDPDSHETCPDRAILGTKLP